MEELIPKIQDWITDYGMKVVGAIIILIVGRWIAGFIRSMLRKILTKKKLDPTIVSFVCNLTYIALLTFVILAVLDKLGVENVSFVAVIGAAGLAIGLALQGSLSNFAAGFLMILFRPFKAGDYIEGAGTAGIVEEIQVFTTILKTPDNKNVIIPNAKLMGDNIINYSANDTRRIELIVGVSYNADIRQVKQVLQEIASQESRVLQDPAPQIAVKELGDSSVNFVFRVWAKTTEYWDVYFSLTEAVKLRLDEEGIGIPFPQHDVHLFEHK